MSDPFAENAYDDDPWQDGGHDAPAVVSTPAADSAATTGLVCGLLSLFAWLLPIAGLPLSIFGIVKSGNGLSSAYRGRAIGGLVLSIIGLLLTLVNAAAGAWMAVNGDHPLVN